MKRKLSIAVIVVIGLAGLAVFFGQNENLWRLPTRLVQLTVPPAASPVAISLSFEATADDQTALDLLEESAQVEYKQFDFGVMVTSINGVAADDKHYWAFYVNDQYAPAGVSETILKTGDTMRWVYEEISQAHDKNF